MTISCIIPTCDRPEMLREALACVFRQSRRADEVIIVDNGSSPIELPSEYSSKVRVLSLSGRSGVSKARNAGANAATGELLAFLDDDDLWGVTYLENAAKAIEEGADCAVSRLDKMEHGAISEYKNAEGALTIRNLLMFNPGVTGSNVVVGKKAFDLVGGYDESLTVSEDKSLIIELLQHGSRVCVLPDNQAIQRIHAQTRLSDIRSLAPGVKKFTKKYKALMSWSVYFFNRRKYYRYIVEDGSLFAYIPLAMFALLYRVGRMVLP